MSNASAPDEEEFRAENDVRTLVEAEEIKADKPRLKRAMKMAERKMKALENVRDA